MCEVDKGLKSLAPKLKNLNCAPILGKSKSYGAILKSTSILGGSQAIVYILGFVRTKIIAVLLGTAGIGLIGIYSSIISLANALSNMGLTSSGVREISSARGTADAQLVAEIRVSIFRTAIILGLIGAVTLALLAPLLSQLLFDSEQYILPIALIGSILFFNGINVAQRAVIQGHRRVGDLARMSILGAVASTVIAVGLYYPLGGQGIVPALIVISLIDVVLAWYYSRDLCQGTIPVSWLTTWLHSKRLLTVGAAVAWGMLLAQAVPFYAKSLIVKNLGVNENGLYVAAFAISGLFANFVLNAMSADYFPRLSEVADHEVERNRLVNEQTEIGILLVLPCVLFAYIFAPFIIQFLYSDSFAEASVLLRWFLLGVLARVINWPLGMIILARGDSKIFATVQTFTAGLHCLWITLLFYNFGVVGAAMAFGLHNLLVVFVYTLGSRILYDFRWTQAVWRLLFLSALSISAIGLLSYYCDGIQRALLTVGVALVISFLCLKSILVRLKGHARIDPLLSRLPRWIKI